MGEEHKEELAERLKRVQDTIYSTAVKSGREPDQIQLVVVTKEKSAVVAKELTELGISQIGESYLKEAFFKMDLLQDYDISWHMIGSIQSGKARQVAGSFDAVHSVDRLDLAKKLAEGAEAAGRTLPIFLECNVSAEDTKIGWEAWEEDSWDELAKALSPVFALDQLRFLGLMTMAPYFEEPERSRPYFQRLRRLSEYLRKQFPEHLQGGLSMGMSADYQIAIQEGATHLRIGSRIVGPRR